MLSINRSPSIPVWEIYVTRLSLSNYGTLAGCYSLAVFFVMHDIPRESLIPTVRFLSGRLLVEFVRMALGLPKFPKFVRTGGSDHFFIQICPDWQIWLDLVSQGPENE